MPRKRPAPIDASRLKIIAAAQNDGALLAHVTELIAGGKRQQREAALEALIERPLPDARALLRDLYLELEEDAPKRDAGAIQRSLIIRILRKVCDQRDADIALRASETVETALGQDVTRGLRAMGLMLLADLNVELLAFYAAEHLDDANYPNEEHEPASTAVQILIDIGEYVAVYHWLRTSGQASPALERLFELFSSAPRGVVQRLAVSLIAQAVARRDERLCTTLAETIIRLELHDAYAALGSMFDARASEELRAYVCLLLARTDNDELLAILEQQLHDHRTRDIALDALRMRDAPKQQAIVARWEDEHG
jgi:hypothetical protein